MRKFEKLFLLKQIIKAASELGKYQRLTRKQTYPKEYQERLQQAVAKYREVKPADITRNPRFLHIAYSMLKGKKYEQIETYVRTENKLTEWDWKHINKVMELYKDEVLLETK